jgi:hypothetical protein
VWWRAGYQKKIEKLIFIKDLNRTLYSLLVQCALLAHIRPNAVN